MILAMNLLTTTEVAARLKVTPRRILAMIEAGKIRAIRPGREYLIEESALVGVKTYGRPGRPKSKKQRRAA
jgi:excisionase family DNA binding protein